MSVWDILPLITAVVYAVLFVTFLRSWSKRSGREFLYYLAVSAIWSSTYFLLRLNAFPALVLPLNEFLFAAALWSSVAYYQFIRARTGTAGKNTLGAAYALLLLFSALLFTNRVVTAAAVTDGIIYTSPAISTYFAGAAVLVISALGGYVVAGKVRSEAEPSARNRMGFLLSGWAIYAVLSLTNLIPAMSRFSLDNVGGVLNTLIIAYSVSQERLPGINLVIRRVIGFIPVFIIFAGVYVISVILQLRFLPQQPFVGIFGFPLVLFVALVMLYRRLQSTIQERIDRSFFKDSFQHRKNLLGFGSNTRSTFDLKEMAGIILPEISRAVAASEVQLLLEDPVSGDFKSLFSHPESDSTSLLRLDRDNPVVEWLKSDLYPIYLVGISNSGRYSGLSAADRQKVSLGSFELLCPLTNLGKMTGIIALGRKSNNKRYSQDDIELLLGVANRAGIVVENARLYSQAVDWAYTDDLTKLSNYRYFSLSIKQEIARSSRFNTTFSLIMLDIDHFKRYNDTLGHLAGDRLLIDLAWCIQSSVRAIDTPFRYGGDEFIIILPETGSGGAYLAAERIRHKITEKFDAVLPPVTASIGVASWPENGKTEAEIVGAADAALYLAKQTGRDRIERYHPESNQLTLLEPSSVETGKAKRTSGGANPGAQNHSSKDSHHCLSRCAVALGEALNFPAEKIAGLRIAGLLLEAVKIVRTDSVLNQNGNLSDAEWQLIKQQAELGKEIAARSSSPDDGLPVFRGITDVKSANVSDYDAGDVSPEARVLAIADVYNDMISGSLMSTNRSSMEALDELKRFTGAPFDANYVEIFCKSVGPALTFD